MKLFNDIRNIINEDNFKLILDNNSVDIINFNKIININDNLVTIKPNKKINIHGKNLKINKLLDDEIIIRGEIFKIDINE